MKWASENWLSTKCFKTTTVGLRQFDICPAYLPYMSFKTTTVGLRLVSEALMMALDSVSKPLRLD